MRHPHNRLHIRLAHRNGSLVRRHDGMCTIRGRGSTKQAPTPQIIYLELLSRAAEQTRVATFVSK